MAVQNTLIAAPPKQLVVEDGFRFSHGQTIAPFTIHYETFGELNAEKSNAILVCHALSASAHAAGKYTGADDERPGWWDGLIGHGKGIDLDKFFVICANIPGSCYGTTAPQSLDAATGKAYGSRYPWPTIEDMVHSQKILLDRLGIPHLRSVAGGSLGGMQVLMWAACYPDFMDSIITMAAGGTLQQPFAKWRGRTLLVSFDTDWLFPVTEVERVEAAMAANGTPVQHERILSPNGHDTFLIDYGLITEPVRTFLAKA